MTDTLVLVDVNCRVCRLLTRVGQAASGGARHCQPFDSATALCTHSATPIQVARLCWVWGCRTGNQLNLRVAPASGHLDAWGYLAHICLNWLCVNSLRVSKLWHRQAGPWYNNGTAHCQMLTADHARKPGSMLNSAKLQHTADARRL